MKIYLKRYLVKLCVIILVIGGLSGCGGNLSWTQRLSKNNEPVIPAKVAVNTKTPMKVALLVPLTGKYAEVGKQLLDAAQLALFHFKNPNLELIPIDTKDTAQGAEQAAQKAVSERVSLILGPLFSDTTRIVSPIVASAGIQVISFSNDKSLVNTGAFVIGLRPEQQIARIVQFVNIQYGVEHMALLLPEGQAGEVMQKATTETLAEYNKRVALVKTEFYPAAGGNDAAIEERTHAAYTALLELPDPAHAYQKKGALLMTEGGENLKKIASALSKEADDKKQVQLVGMAALYDPSILAVPALEGVVFASLPQEQQQNFEQKLFMSAYGYKPKTVASLAYDGVALAATLGALKEGSISRDMLTNRRGFVGVNGIFRLNNNGLVERGLAVMEIDNGKFVVIDPAPRAFSP